MLVILLEEVCANIPTFPFKRFIALASVILPLLTILVLFATIPNSASLDVPLILPLLVKTPVPFANIPTKPPVVFVLLIRFILRLFEELTPE